MIVIVRPDGSVTAIAHATTDGRRLASLGDVRRVRRGGHVVPAAWWRRAAFRLIRRTFAESSPVAEWTRRWPGEWLTDLRVSGGPVLGPFETRAEAIRAEEEHMLGVVQNAG